MNRQDAFQQKVLGSTDVLLERAMKLSREADRLAELNNAHREEARLLVEEISKQRELLLNFTAAPASESFLFEQ